MASTRERVIWGLGVFLPLVGVAACGGVASGVGGESHFLCRTQSDCTAHPDDVCFRADLTSETGECTSSATIDTATAQQAIMTRWNDTVDAAGTAIDFHWPSFDKFPHPTFKGGSEDAYAQFGAILLSFFQRGDDFDFLAQNHLFQSQLLYVLPSSAPPLETSFQKLATDFSTAGFMNIPESTRQGIKSFADRM
jgi:hypothetical protein